MLNKIEQVMDGKVGNYLVPFFWVHEGKTEFLAERVRKVYQSGCRALCVESRPHEDFCGEKWWEDIRIILEEAKRYDMKVWILDDKHFPTGYANGRLKKEGRVHRRWFLREHHVDVYGPMREASILVPQLQEEEEILTVSVYKRADCGNRLGELVGDLSENICGNFLYWDIPDGFYRIFFVIRTRQGSRQGEENYISSISKESVQELIKAVYEPHYMHFSEYFGNVLQGFFSDEPGYYTRHLGVWGYDQGDYYHTVGQPGLALPWENTIIPMLKADIETTQLNHVVSRLPELWYPSEFSAVLRLAYMNTVTKLWEECFSMQIGGWCRDHHVQYIGHVIEDMDAHQRIGTGAGHYFRALKGQDMSGIDIVLHQVMPGYADHDVAAIVENGSADHRFYHYVLPKLAVSLARTEPGMHNRAMCEVFGAYGWAENDTFMKWLIDFLLVRGVNRFVPHAFTDDFPDEDCPPHFYARGNNPQFCGFSQLMTYTNQVVHLLEGLDLQVAGAILYTAEEEWMNAPQYVSMNDAAKILYDAHIDFDILPLDYLVDAEIENGIIKVRNHSYKFLIIPEAKQYPDQVIRIAERFSQSGIPVYWGAGTDMVEDIFNKHLAWKYTDENELLRIGFFKKESAACFMVFWESVCKDNKTSLRLPVKGKFIRCELIEKKITKDYTSDGNIEIMLSPYQSEILIFDEFDPEWWERLPGKEIWSESEEINALWDISLLEQGRESVFHKVKERSKLFSITGQEAWPDFSGRILYETELDCKMEEETGLDLGVVGGTARLKINGKDMGIRISPPYRWNITKTIRTGKNQISIEVANSLVNRVKDRFSEFMQISPSGLLGPVMMYKIKRGKNCSEGDG